MVSHTDAGFDMRNKSDRLAGGNVFASVRRFGPLLVLAAVPALLTVTTRALGQGAPATEAADTSTKLEEVVVTARKRSESFQDVPIAVDAFTAQDIHAAGIENPRDFIAMVPNMTLVETQNVGNAFITIRGISQARNSEPSVAVVVDGVEETNPYEFNQNWLISSRSRC
jgi:iron complex outermembrane receptor protein